MSGLSGHFVPSTAGVHRAGFRLLETPFLHHSQFMGSTWFLAKAKIAVGLGVGMVSYLVAFLVQTHSWEDFQKPLAIFSLEVIFHVSISSQFFFSL